MTGYPESEIRIWLRLKPHPLLQIEETEGEWWLGSLSIGKRFPHYRVGHSHPLGPTSRLFRQRFDLDDSHRGWAVIFRFVDPPLHSHMTDVFVGWVQPDRGSEADRWITFLNEEIAKRLATTSTHAEPKLRSVGRFRELGYGETAPSLVAARGKRAPRNKAEVVRYLRGAKMQAFSPGVERDVFDETKLADSPSIRTDGVYSWPELIGYYVEKYDIELPEDFEEHMRANSWTVPRSTQESLQLPEKP